jgi:L-glyceraldehyde 3-phosphate reductase
LRFKTVTSVLIGASRVAQIDDAVGVLNTVSFTDDELRTIEIILKGDQK